MPLVRRFFPGLLAEVSLTSLAGQFVPMGVSQETGVIETGRQSFSGFKLKVYAPFMEDTKVVVTMKNISLKGGAYKDLNIEGQVTDMAGYYSYAMTAPIQVMRVGANTWTRWHPDPKGGPEQTSNRLDVWSLKLDGTLSLFQVGVVSHDDGRTFRLLGERIWEGKVFRNPVGEFVTMANGVEWGAFTDTRRHIFNHPLFANYLKAASLEIKEGDKEVVLPLGALPEQNGHSGDYARIQWYICFAGQKGQGIAILRDGSSAWVNGQDLETAPDPDGIKRLRTNVLVHYEGAEKNWGSQDRKPPKLTNVTLVKTEA